MELHLSFYSTLFTITQILCFSNVSADFCEWFICHPTEQYCCGDNRCCNYFNYTTWYLWGGAVMVGLLLTVIYYILCAPSCLDRLIYGGIDNDGDKAAIIK